MTGECSKSTYSETRYYVCRNARLRFLNCKCPKRSIRAVDIEIAVAKLFNFRTNNILSCVTWGCVFDYELDILVLTPAGYGYEIEIKITKSDLKADKVKQHFHDSEKIKKFYYALPYYLLLECEKLIPDWAGIISVKDGKANITRKAKIINKYKFTTEKMLHLTRLAAEKIWVLKNNR